MKIDPLAKSEPVQQLTEPETEPPLTPVPSRRRPDEETDATPTLGAWTSPAFFQRSRVSYGGLVDSGLDPFAEEDGFVPGKGRKRPRFSMRSNEWRVVDEPASPGEKASPVDWTEDINEDESVETEAESEGAVEDIEMSEEAPKASDAATEDTTTISTEQPVPEIGPSIEGPVEPTTTKLTEAAYQANGNGELAGTLQVPIDTPRLLPVPSPGLPVPSPLVSTTPDNGYFTSTAAAPTSQPITTVIQSETTKADNNGAPEEYSETLQVETGDSTLNKAENISSLSGFTAVADIPQEPEVHTAADMTEQTPREIQSEELESAAAHEARLPPFPESTTPIGEPPLMDALHYYPQDIEMEGERNAAKDSERNGGGRASSESDESEEVEDEDDVQQEEESDEEDQDEEEDPEYDEPVPIGNITDQEDRVQAIARPFEEDTDALDEQESRETVLVEAESPEDYSEPEGDYDEGEEEQQDEDMDEAGEEYDSEYEYQDRPEDIVDSEMGSGEDDDEPSPAQAPAPAPVTPKNVQPDVIVLDSDDEDEPPPGPPMQQFSQFERGSDVESQGVEEWPSDEEEEMTDGEGYEDQSGDEYYQDGELVEVGDEEEVENKQPEGQVELQEGGERVDEEEEQEDTAAEQAEEQVKSPDDHRWVEDEDADEDEDEKAVESEHPEEPVKSLEDGRREDEEVAEAENEADENDKSFDDKRYDQVELVDRTGRIDDGDKAADKAQERSETEDDADVFVEPSEYNTPHDEPPASTHEIPSTEDPSLQPEEAVDQHEARPAFPDESQEGAEKTEPDPQQRYAELVYDGAASPGEWYDAPTDAEGSGTEDEDGPSRQLAAEHEMQMDALAQSGSRSLSSPIHDNATDPDSDSNSDPDTPNRHYPGLRSKLSYFAPLASLSDNFNTLIDTISIVYDASAVSQSLSGKRDYLLTLHVTDPSMAGATVPAQIFRPFEEALPRVREGDAILLRDFRVGAFNHAMCLVSVDVSAWAVFTDGHSLEGQNNKGQEAQAQIQAQKMEITGPPVEYGLEENSYATDLRQWYHEDGASKVADSHLQASIDLASRGRSSSEASFDSDSVGLGLGQGLGLTAGPDGRRSLLRRSRRSHRRITIHELRDGRRYTEVGSPSDRESIHELRDGTVYANL